MIKNNWPYKRKAFYWYFFLNASKMKRYFPKLWRNYNKILFLCSWCDWFLREFFFEKIFHTNTYQFGKKCSFSIFLLYEPLLNKILRNPKQLVVIGCRSGTRNLTGSYEDVLTFDIVNLTDCLWTLQRP